MMTIAAIIALFLFYSSSPAWAHAFGSSASSLVQPTRRSSSCYAVATPHRSVMSLPSSLFMLRGGEQEEQDRVAEVGDESHNTNDSVEEELHYSDSKSMDDENPSTLISATVLTPLSSLGSFYAHQLRTRPIQTKSVTAGIIFGLSDYFAQTIERGKDDDAGKNKKEIVKSSRILTSFLVGLCIFGPAANKWYSTMFKIWPSTALLPTLIKAFLGQLLFGPAFTW